MKWESEWGDKLEMLERLQDQGIDPPALLNKPECSPWIVSYIMAYQRLSRTRRITAEGIWLPIQLTEIKAYLDLYDSDHDIEMFTDIITLVDTKRLNSKNK